MPVQQYQEPAHRICPGRSHRTTCGRSTSSSTPTHRSTTDIGTESPHVGGHLCAQGVEKAGARHEFQPIPLTGDQGENLITVDTAIMGREVRAVTARSPWNRTPSAFFGRTLRLREGGAQPIPIVESLDLQLLPPAFDQSSIRSAESNSIFSTSDPTTRRSKDNRSLAESSTRIR